MFLTSNQWGEPVYIGNFTSIIKTPSGAAGVNFRGEKGFETTTLILGITFADFLEMKGYSRGS